MRRVVFLAGAALVIAGLVVGVTPRRGAAVASSFENCPAALPGVQFYAPATPGTDKTVALTFDDGPGPSTAAILAILNRFRVRATFFNIGEQEAEWPADVVAEEADGFLVGDHTWSHPSLPSLSPARQAAQIDEVISEQRSLVGTAPCVLRPPYGTYDQTTLALARQRHLSVWLWSVDTEDWEAEGSGASYWVDRIIDLAESEGGALHHPVVLMHNQAIAMPATVAALPTIIEYFESRGYRFVDLLGRSGPPAGCGTRVPEEVGGGQTLQPEERLSSGSRLRSSDGQYSLRMQRDGNLVLTSTGRVLWASGTYGHPDASAVMQPDGNFVIVSHTGRALWETRTAGHPGATFSLQGDGDVSVQRSGVVLWSTQSTPDSLVPGQTLHVGWFLFSNGSACRLTMEPGGNLVLSSVGGRPLWQTGARPGSQDRTVLRPDGELEIETSTSGVAWESGTHGEDELDVSRDGTILLESPQGEVLWFR